MRSISILVAAFMIMALVIGCSGGQSPVPEDAKIDTPKGASDKTKAVKKAEKTEPGKVDQKIKQAVLEASTVNVNKGQEVLDKVGIAYSYDPVNKPDPFRIYQISDQEPTGFLSGNPLLRFEVRYLRLVGVYMTETEPKALFEDPNGHAYVVQIGDRIGRGGGIVQAIDAETVVVTETRISTRSEGGTETVQIPINLHPVELEEETE